MHQPEELIKIINERIRAIDLNRQPAELYDPITYTLDLGGKRMRPVLCLMACEMFGGNFNAALDPAIGLEIFHNFTLLHDDIMDAAPLRRGRETVYKKWNSNIAILSGDTMMALSYNFIMNAPEHHRMQVFEIFNRAAVEVCEGQQYDMNFENREEVSISEYIDMIRLKTAVLPAAGLKIGALIGEANEMDAELVYRFGENIGIAFQLKDDLLDVFSNRDKFGKATGGDILSNKKTFLYLKALSLADQKISGELRDYFSGRPTEPQEKIDAVTAIYEQLNIREITEQEIDRYYQIALNSFESLTIDTSSKKTLLDFAGNLKQREF